MMFEEFHDSVYDLAREALTTSPIGATTAAFERLMMEAASAVAVAFADVAAIER